MGRRRRPRPRPRPRNPKGRGRKGEFNQNDLVVVSGGEVDDGYGDEYDGWSYRRRCHFDVGEVVLTSCLNSFYVARVRRVVCWEQHQITYEIEYSDGDVDTHCLSSNMYRMSLTDDDQHASLSELQLRYGTVDLFSVQDWSSICSYIQYHTALACLPRTIVRDLVLEYYRRTGDELIKTRDHLLQDIHTEFRLDNFALSAQQMDSPHEEHIRLLQLTQQMLRTHAHTHRRQPSYVDMWNGLGLLPSHVLLHANNPVEGQWSYHERPNGDGSTWVGIKPMKPHQFEAFLHTVPDHYLKAKEGLQEWLRERMLTRKLRQEVAVAFCVSDIKDNRLAGSVHALEHPFSWARSLYQSWLNNLRYELGYEKLYTHVDAVLRLHEGTEPIGEYLGEILVSRFTTVDILMDYMLKHRRALATKRKQINDRYIVLRELVQLVVNEYKTLVVSPKQFEMEERTERVNEIIEAYQRLLASFHIINEAIQFPAHIPICIIPDKDPTTSLGYRLQKDTLLIPTNFDPHQLIQRITILAPSTCKH